MTLQNQKILVIGASGSGSSTLGQALAHKHGSLWLDLDDYYWLPTPTPYTEKRDPQTRYKMVLEDFQSSESVIVSGSPMNWGSALEDGFNLIVFLYLDTKIRVERLRVREIKELGKADPAFLEWAGQYDQGPQIGGRSLNRHNAWLNKRSCPILRLEGDQSIQKRISQVESASSFNEPIKPQ